MFCGKCGKEFESVEPFCTSCGAPNSEIQNFKNLNDEETVLLDENVINKELNNNIQITVDNLSSNENAADNLDVANSNRKEGNIKRGNNKKIIIPIFILVAVLLAGGIMFFLKKEHKEDKYKKQLDIANDYFEELDYEKAIAAYEDAIKINPKSEKAYLDLAEVYITMASNDSENKDYARCIENYSKAIQTYDRLIEVDENSKKASIGKADVYMLMSDCRIAGVDNTDVEYGKALDDCNNALESLSGADKSDSEISKRLELAEKRINELQNEIEAYRAEVERLKAEEEARIKAEEEAKKEKEEQERLEKLKNAKPISMSYFQSIDHGNGEVYYLDYTLKFKYNSDNQLINVKNYDKGNNQVASVDLKYDSEGRCLREYSLGFSTEELSLMYNDLEWNGDLLVKTKHNGDENYYIEYVYDNDGRIIKSLFYSDGELYMEETREYDKSYLKYYSYRENYWGNWYDISTTYYEYDVDSPYRCEGEEISDGISTYYSVEWDYEYDEYDRIICEEMTFTSDSFSYEIVKTYEY